MQCSEACKAEKTVQALPGELLPTAVLLTLVLWLDGSRSIAAAVITLGVVTFIHKRCFCLQEVRLSLGVDFLVMPVAIISVMFGIDSTPLYYLCLGSMLLGMLLLPIFRQYRRVGSGGNDVEHPCRIHLIAYTHAILLFFSSMLFFVALVGWGFQWQKVLVIRVFPLIIASLVWLFVVGQFIGYCLIHRRLKKEQWLPILSLDGRRVGRIAQSTAVRQKLPAGYLLPIVRILLLGCDMIFLIDSSRSKKCATEAYDTPLCDFLPLGTGSEEMADRLLKKVFPQSVQAHFILQYVHSSPKEARYVYLYLCEVQRPEDLQLKDCGSNTGKWWPLDQVQSNPTLDFSPFLWDELPFVVRVIRPASLLHHQAESGASNPK